MDSFGDKKKKSEFSVESLEDDDHISIGGEQLEFCFWKLKNLDFIIKISNFLGTTMDIGRISTHGFCFRENESTTLLLWRDMTGKDEKEFRLESRTLKERFLRDFVEGTLWIRVVKVVILEKRLRAKIKKWKIREQIMIIFWILESGC